MSIQIKAFTLPIHVDSAIETEMNAFLKSHKVINIRKEFANNSDNLYWCFLVEYVAEESESAKQNKAVKNTIDYKEVLSPEDFSVYAQIREWRKEVAEKNGLQLYAILKNEQMATIAQEKITSLDKLAQIPGIGEQRIKKYGKDILEIMKNIVKMNPAKNSQTANEKNP
ncbi:MAG: HRDC domain-containing protein [Candidatus Magnetomorum sp.]|nr:HRDC domain-containing protein [Candidatus Magnetomorum sp.]